MVASAFPVTVTVNTFASVLDIGLLCAGVVWISRR